MKFEEIISSFVMVIVTGLVLVGFTIAWYTNNNLPAVSGVEVVAAQMGSVQITLKPESEGGVDISELENDQRYAEIGVEDFLNIDEGELAPGVYGQVTFYVKPVTSAVTTCSIVPMLRISQDGDVWYPAVESMDGSADSDEATDDTVENGEGDDAQNDEGDDVEPTLEKLYELASAHIEFFVDEEMTQKLDANNPYQLSWGTGEGETEPLTEQKATIYWKWHYEYPFTEQEALELTAEQKEVLIDRYDEEDMTIGNNISAMKFYFTFSAQ